MLTVRSVEDEVTSDKVLIVVDEETSPRLRKSPHLTTLGEGEQSGPAGRGSVGQIVQTAASAGPGPE